MKYNPCIKFTERQVKRHRHRKKQSEETAPITESSLFLGYASKGGTFLFVCDRMRQPSRSSRRELRQLNKSLRICDIRLTTSDIAFRQLYSPDGELRIYLI